MVTKVCSVWEQAMIRIGLVLPPGFQVMSVAAMSAFELANAYA
jgi:hypothetical protein